jgi:hypothetical protein
VLAGGGVDEVSNVIGSVEASDGWEVMPVEAGLPSVLEVALETVMVEIGDTVTWLVKVDGAGMWLVESLSLVGV